VLLLPPLLVLLVLLVLVRVAVVVVNLLGKSSDWLLYRLQLPG